MDKILTIISELKEVADYPAQAIKKQMNATGKKAVGCLPVYCPEEIIYAANMLPVGIWGGQTTISKANKYFPAFACSIMQSVMELSLNGVYDDLATVIIPSPCDTLKTVVQNWISGVPQVKCIPIVHPQMSRIEEGVIYLQTEYERVKKEMEAISGQKITNEALTKSIEIYNQYRQTMREFTEFAAVYPEVISPVVRHAVIKSAFFMDKAEHMAMVKELIAELGKLPVKEWNGSKLILTGIMFEPANLIEIIEENRAAIVADDLAHESRLFRTDVPEGNDPMERLARQWQHMKGCSLVYDPKKNRGQMIIEQVKKTGANGVVMCMMKFCDPEEFDYPILKKEMEAAGIPMLYLEIDQQMQSVEQARTRIQSFAEMIANR
ncbi:MAG: 2-hydroxyacyl-CoA dehydratase family protein [Bacillota bacterium]|nr:2-hydroxyacyl-CoA dehydratase family protein [Bacillota bacterium]